MMILGSFFEQIYQLAKNILWIVFHLWPLLATLYGDYATLMLWIIFMLMSEFNVKTEALPGYRLPGNVKPLHYKLDIISDLDDFSFKGNVTIRIKCLKTTNEIVLHCEKLIIPKDSIKVEEVGGTISTKLNVISHGAAPQNPFHVIKLGDQLKLDKEYQIYIPFNGVLLYSLDGYYRSSYYDRTCNLTKWIGVTQFAPTDARKAFPCFDEPGLKARFSIRLGHKNHLKAISNMPQTEVAPMEGSEGWVWTEFQETVEMSTYLVGWVISDFEHQVSAPQKSNVTFRIWARKEAKQQVKFASEVGPKVLKYYETLFDIKYPLPKQDMIAIPDFRFNAMENWGLITYRETVLLYDTKQSSVFDKESIASVIAHELAHQWFGNLVTMEWWTDLWLNEGFATYVGSLGANHVFPEWNHVSNAAMDNIEAVLKLDALKSSHQISIVIENPAEIDQIFDDISYKKGSTIIRMMHKFLSNSFLVGVSNYLKKHKYGNAEQDNLWEALTEQAHKDGVMKKNMTVKQVMDSWTLQTGYPLLTITRDYESGTATITQKRFLRIPEETEEETIKWWVPITYTTQSEKNFTNTVPSSWLTPYEKEPTVIQGLPRGNDQWVIFNIDLTALCRVQYDNHNWELIINTLSSDEFATISPTNRAGLLLDIFAFAKRGDISYDLAFQLSSYLSRETDFIPFSEGLSALSSISALLKRTSGYGYFKKYMRTLISPIVERYGKLTDVPSTLEQIKMRNLAFSWACHLNLLDYLDEVMAMFKQWDQITDLEENNPIPTDLQSIVYCAAVRKEGEKVWNKLWNRYTVSNYGAEKKIIIEALSCVRDVWLINRYLEWSIDENSGIRRQDSATIFSYIISQEHGFYVAKDFLHRRIQDIHKCHEYKPHILGKYLSAYATEIIYEDELEAFKELIKTNKKYFGGAKLQADQSLEYAMANVKWHKHNYKAVMEKLKTM